MNLYRAYQNVLACQEAMWEELKDRIRNKKDQLKQFGWDDDEELEELQSRNKFERIVERYRRWVILFHSGLFYADSDVKLQRYADKGVIVGFASQLWVVNT